jgi:hypothetical protein
MPGMILPPRKSRVFLSGEQEIISDVLGAL